MQSAPQSNAMAEIALALAMAFFSILVLTMVSMGAGFGHSPVLRVSESDGLALQPSAPDRSPADGGRSEPASRASIVIYHQGRFLDARLAALRPEDLAGTGPVVLAVDPTLPMTEAMAARQRLAATELTVTTLDEPWMKALREMSK